MDISDSGVTRLREAPAAPHATEEHVSVGLALSSGHPRESLLVALRTAQELKVLAVQDNHRADVLVAVADAVDDALVDALAGVSDSATNHRQQIVLVSDQIQRRHLPRLFRAGVAAVLTHRDATPQRIIRAVFACHHGQAVLPGRLTRWLLDEVRFGQQNVLDSQNLALGGLTAREVEVLRLIAQGDETAEVAAKLNYSERTIKKALQDVLVRLRLQNRAHAVSYAMRVGAI